MSSQSQRIARNIFVTLVTQLGTWAMTFVVTLFLPHYINDKGLGAITLAGSISGILSVFVALGMSTVLITEIARDTSRLGSLVAAGFAVRVPLSIAAFGTGWIAIRLLGYPASLDGLILLAIATMILGQITDVLFCALRGLEDFPRQNGIMLLEKVLNSGAILAIIFARGTLWEIVAVSAVTGAISLLLSLAAVLKHAKRACISLRFTIDPAQMRFLVMAGLPFLASAVFTAVYGQSDSLLLSKMSSVAAIGWYGLATRLGGSTLLIPTTLCGTMLPMMVRVFKDDYPRFEFIVQRLFNLMLLCVIPFAAILIFAPAQILTILHYPPSFRHSVPVMMVMGGGIVFWFLSQAAGTALIACNRQHVFARVTGFAALVSVPLCALCIFLAERHLSNGAVGAVVSDVLIEAGMVIAYICCLPPHLFTRAVGGVFVRASIAAVPMVILFILAHGDRAALYLPGIGLLLYIPLCLLMGCIHPKDIELMRDQFMRRSHVH